MSKQENRTLHATIEYEGAFKRTVAEIEVPEITVNDAYTIAVGDAVSIRFDGHVPLHFVQVVSDQSSGAVGVESVFERLFGVEFSSAMSEAPSLGMLSVNFELTPENRHYLAILQHANPSTPPLLKRTLAGILGLQLK